MKPYRLNLAALLTGTVLCAMRWLEGSQFPVSIPVRPTNAGVVLVWGDNYSGQTNVPTSLTNVVAIAAALGSHCLALRMDGRVAAWGDNSVGQTDVPDDLTDVVAIAAGGTHSLALRSNGTVVGWGSYSHGGNYVPMTVPAGLTNVVGIAGGFDHSLVLTAEGRVIAWGGCEIGCDNVLTNVPPGLTNIVTIAAGGLQNLMLDGAGRAIQWPAGPDNYAVTAADVASIASGSSHNLALKSDGTVLAWGENVAEETSVPAGLKDVVAIGAGNTHSLALRIDGTLVHWGNRIRPWLAPPAGLGGVEAIAAGGDVSMALGRLLLAPGPQDAFGIEGGAVTFTTTPFGVGPLTYQWYFNGMALADATNSSLTLSNLSTAHAGSYTVRVRGHLAQTLSPPAKLFVTPRNDLFAQPVHVAGGGGHIFGANVNATSEPGEPNHANASGGHSLWYLWTSPVSAAVTFDTIGSTFDTVLAVYQGTSLGNLALVAADDDGAGFNQNSRVTFSARSNATYIIAIDGYHGATGGVVLNVTPVLSFTAVVQSPDGSIAMQVFAPAAHSVVLEAGSDLRTWTPVATNLTPPVGLLEIPGQRMSGGLLRFYRVRLEK